MNILIVYAYPNEHGFNHEIKNRILKNIDDKHSIKVIDLYKEQFNPVLYFDKELQRRNLYLDQETQGYRRNIQEANYVIFIYPIWWGGMPAILKGFIDRVFAKDFAYKYKGILPIGLLKGKKAWIINTHDSPGWYVKLFQQDYGKILKRQILKFCGIKKVKHTSLPFVRNTNKKQRKAFLKKIEDMTKKL